MNLLTNTAQIYLDGGADRSTFALYKTSSAEKHKGVTDETLKQALIQALSAPVSADKTHQGDGVYRVKINGQLGYLVYKRPANAGEVSSAAIFHYHWNYNLDMPLTAT